MPGTFTVYSCMSRFLRNESGAVAVDWVVLTAAVTGLAIGTAASVRTGSSELGGDISTALSSAEVASLDCMGVNDGPSGFECYTGPTINYAGLIMAWESPGYCTMNSDGTGFCTPNRSGTSQQFYMSDGETYTRTTTTVDGQEQTEVWRDSHGNEVEAPPPMTVDIRNNSGCWHTPEGYLACV